MQVSLIQLCSMSKRLLFLILLIVFVFLINSCGNQNPKKKYIIGFSQCTGDNNWRKATLEGVKKEISFYPGTQLIYKSAGDNSDLQIKQIKELVNQNIDILLVSPNEARPLTPVIEEVFNKGIPVVVIDRRISSNSYTSFVGADNFEIGRMAGNYVANFFHDSARVIEVIGLPGSTPAGERQRGFAKGIEVNPKIFISRQVFGNWLKQTSYNEILKEKEKLAGVNLVFAQNDPMALGAYEAFQKLGIKKMPLFIGVDGLASPGGGIELVSDKILKATLLNPTGGEEAIQVAFKILNNEPFNKENTLQTVLIDSSNVRIMKLQSDKIQSQQRDIERQQNILEEEQRVYDNQRIILCVLFTTLVIAVGMVGIILYSLYSNRKINRRLKQKNEEISRQSLQLIEMSAKAEEAHQARINFFTNISHEFRTPLTLIFAPLGELISNTRIQQETKQSLQLIQRNVMRLYRLVSQLMDFRKIEFKKMKLHVSEIDIISFTNEIVNSFKILAKNKNIDLKFFTAERSLYVWMDTTMIDKVIFNVLSNAFKFTSDHGLIHITVSKDNNNAIVKIEDDGIGMTKEVIAHAFEPFFQGEYENYKGTGLGLALSKELMELHHGSIKVMSERRRGSTFAITLPLGNAHFEKSEFELPINKESSVGEDADIYTTDLYDINNLPKPDFGSVLTKYLTILIVEDNNEMLEYLSSRLGTEYNIVEAVDSNSALQSAFDAVPDLILCDIVIPGKNGLELTQIFKSDVRTSHIPVILLTAKDQENQKIEGMETQADAYITKPFNLVFLQKTIKSLLQNREKIKDHYSGEIFSEEKSQLSKKADRKFMIEFTAIVENNISNDKFGVNDICKELGISRVQLYRKVKTVLNCNVNDYIITTRLQKAKYYMQHENLSISEIAFKSGFSSAAYFSTVFKSKFGVTPSAFKEN